MPSVAVVGAGYAGVRAARRLSGLLDAGWSITLVDRRECHQLLTRLPEVVGGRLAPDRACIPFGRILPRRVEALQAEVKAIDPSTRRLITSRGSITADWLIVSVGSVPDYAGVPGAKEHGLILRSVESAISLRDAIERLLAARTHLRIVIVGGGYTGTEIAGELAYWNHRLTRPPTSPRIQITVAEQDQRLLPEGNERLGRAAERILRTKGVRFVLGTAVREVKADGLLLAAAGPVEADIVVWAAHSKSALQAQDGTWQLGRDGRVVVDPYLRAHGHSGVYIAGDAALAYDYRRRAYVPASAQLAVQEGVLAAENLAAEIRGQPLHEFRPRVLGEALSLGGRDGAAEVTGFVVTGRLAVWTKEAALLRYLNGLGGPRLVAEYR